MRLRVFVVVAVLCCFFGADRASAQFFRNNAFTGAVGWQGEGSTFDALAGGKLWNIDDNLTLGAGYTTALGYDLWYDLDVSIGISKVRIPDGADFIPIVALNVFPAGIRYNFLPESFRPFVSASGGTMVVLTPVGKQIPTNDFFGGSSFWAGLRLGGGAEYFFIDDQSLMLDAQFVAFIGANQPPTGGIASFVLPATSVRLVYHIYF